MSHDVKSTLKKTFAKGALQVTSFFGIAPLPGTSQYADDEPPVRRGHDSTNDNMPYWMKDDYWTKTSNYIPAPSAPSFDTSTL
jgi:hypothetical protein